MLQNEVFLGGGVKFHNNKLPRTSQFEEILETN